MAKSVHIQISSQHGTSDSITDLSMLSNPAGAQNVSCLGLCDWIFARKALLNMGRVLSTFMLVSI